MDKVGLGALAVGSVFTYAGIKGYSVPQAVQYIVQGRNPATLPPADQIESPAAGSTPATGGGAQPVTGGGSAQAILQQTAAQYGWGSGAQWQALQHIEMHEAGYDTKATNPTSGAFGLAQAYGHGTSSTKGTLANEYGGYGLTDAQAQAANSGDAATQALWMMNYIKSRYGDPIKAWAFWQAHHSY